MQNDHLPGNTIARGPMASDHYTPVHNLLVRGQVIPTEYVGVWGYIASHAEGWKLTEAKLCKDLSKGKSFVKSALAAIEAANCLIREQQRELSGKLGSSTWFVTDLPLQLRQLGVFDEATIQTKVYEAFQQWKHGLPSETEGKPLKHGKLSTRQNSSAAPMSGNQTSVSSQRSTDVRLTDIGQTDVGSTDVGQPATKKNKDQENQGRENNSSSSSPSPHGSVGNSTEEEEANPSTSSASDNHASRGEQDAATEGRISDAQQSCTAAGTPKDEAIGRFWSGLPNEITPNAQARQGKLTTRVWELLGDPRNTWGAYEDGPELLVDWVQRRIPTRGVGNPQGWLPSQLHYAGSGPDTDGLTQWENCPHGCDENEMLPQRTEDGREVQSRCPVTHRRVNWSPTRDTPQLIKPDYSPEAFQRQQQVSQSTWDALGIGNPARMSRDAPDGDQYDPASGTFAPPF